MQFTTILLIAAAILTFLSGVAVFAGVTRDERAQGAWFFVMTLGTAAWAVGIGMFLALPTNATDVAPWALFTLYVGAMVMLSAFVGYVGWGYKTGRVLTVLYCLVGVGLAGALLYDPSILYSSITLSETGNSIKIVEGWFYWAYIAFCMVTALSMLGFTLYRLLHAKKRSERAGMAVLMIGTSIAGVVLSIFDMLLPLERYDLIWVGPLATSLNILCFYYAILRFRIMTLVTGWLKILSYIIIMMSGAIIYMIAFFAIFTALFHIPSPSSSVLILNFIMVVVMLLLIPVISEISAFVRSLISVQTVDIAYIAKKLNHLAPQNVDMRELASFLADHMHFEYVGFLINGRLYGSSSLPLSADELAQISMLKTARPGSVWQDFNEPVGKICSEQDISAIAELHNAKGKAFGQIIVGKPLGKMQFDRRDLIQMEMIINLVAAVIDSEKHLRA